MENILVKLIMNNKAEKKTNPESDENNDGIQSVSVNAFELRWRNKQIVGIGLKQKQIGKSR